MSDRPPADADPLDAAPPANGSPAAALVPPETLDPAAPPPPDSPPSPPSGPPTPPAPLEPSGFSLRAVGLGLLLLCPWVLLVNGMYMSSAFRLQQLVLLMSFGALLTFFLLKYIFDFLPAAWQLRPPEIAVLYTMLLIGIPSAMLGRLALESAAVAHMADVDSDLAGRKGFVPPNWAPQGHVRMVTHRTPMDPLDWPHAGAPTSSPPPPPASFVVTANQAALRTQAIYTDVLLKYVFAENPNLAAQWQTLQASESPALRAAADRFGAPDGLPYLLWREAAAAPSSPAPPAPPAPAAPAPALAPGKPATPGKSPTPTVTLPDALTALPAIPPQFAAFQAAFDQADAAAVEIFSPFADVVDDAKRYAQYTADQAAHPPVDLNRINRGAESTVACADSLAQAAADALARLAALRAGYTALAHMEKGASPSAGSAWRAVPWSEWLEPMAYWAAVMLAFHGLAFAFLLALRRAWVETERLPFPYTILPERVHQAIPGGIGGLGGQSGFGGQGGLGGNRPAERQSLFSRYWLYLPFLIGLALCLPSILGLSAKNILPPPPDPVDHPHDFSMAGWSIILNVDTWTLALILLFPLDLIFSVLFFFFVGAYAVPYLARMAGIEGFGQNLIPYQMLRMGGFLGLFLGTLWFNRAQMRELLTGRRSTPPSADSPDPVSPRIVTAVFYISLFALVLLLLHGEIGAGAQQVLLFAFGLFVILVYNFQEWRIRAAGGLPNWDFNNIMKVQSWSNWYFFGLHHTSPDPVTALPMPQQQLAWQQLYNTSLLGSYVPTLGPGAYFLEAFRIGDLFRARPRAILKAALLAFVFALLLGMPIYLLGIYHLGINAQPESGSWWNFAHQSDKIFRYYMKRSDGSPFGTGTGAGWAFWIDNLVGSNWRNSLLWTFGGAICVIVLMYYRRNKARFPFHPVGFVIAGTASSGTQMDTSAIWFAWLIALAVKWLIHDWFGVRAFRNKVEPALVYLILGLLTGILIYMILVVTDLHLGATWLEQLR